MLHTSTLLAFLCSHAINPTIAWCKSQVLENALSHHIISAVLLHRAGWAKRKCTFQAVSVDTCSLFLCLLFLQFLAPGPGLAATVPRLAARPWPPLTNGAERRFRISEGEREVEGVCVCLRNQCEMDTDRETGESFTVHHHFKPWVYSSKSMWALQRLSARLKPDPPAGLCFNRHIQWQTSTSFLTLCMDLRVFQLLCEFLPRNVRLSKSGSSTQLMFLLLTLG